MEYSIFFILLLGNIGDNSPSGSYNSSDRDNWYVKCIGMLSVMVIKP